MNSRSSRRRVMAASPALWTATVMTLACVGLLSAQAAGPRALAPGQLPDDVRLGPLKDLDGYFPMVVPESVAAWEARAAELRRQVLVSQGLWPMPTRQPLAPVVHGLIEQDDYTIEKVYFESMPGFFVTGSLYRPKSTIGRVPGVLCPHGHWADGRFYDCGREEVRKQIVKGAERFEDGGRSPLQSRCVQLARMGCVVFHYDMIGYADSQQLSMKVVHGFDKQRPEMNDAQHWGLYSPQAESRLQSTMGLQTYNSVRALDFLTALPDVDDQRIAVTGASGGGTQTFMLAAIDPRVQVAFPAVMVSTSMQGGCTCENACCLRVGTGNIELAALFAPKPLGMTSANDWTLEMPTKGFPELQQLYRLLGAPDQVMLAPGPQFDHNYNYVSRAGMYPWLNRYLGLGLPEVIVEEDYARLTAEQLSVWDDDHPRPEGGPEFERRLLAWWHQDAQQQLDGLLPTDADSCRRYQQVVGGAVAALISRGIPDSHDVDLTVASRNQREGYEEAVGLLTYNLPPRVAIGATPDGKRESVREQLPVVLLRPASSQSHVCILAFPDGKSGLYGTDGALSQPVRRLLDAGITVCAADLLFQGEFLAEKPAPEKTRRVENPRESAAYTFGYNPTLLAQRVRDLLTLLALFNKEAYRADRVDMVGMGEAGPWAAVASAVAGPRVARVAVDQADFRFSSVADLHSPAFLPGGAKYHDLPGILALRAPHPIWLASESTAVSKPVRAAFESLSAAANITSYAGPDDEKLADIATWLVP